MIIRWIIDALRAGADHLELDHERLAQWHAEGACVSLRTPYSTLSGPYLQAYVRGSRNHLVRHLQALDPAQWTAGRIDLPCGSISPLPALLPPAGYESLGGGLWRVPLVAQDINHALDAWSYEIDLSDDDLRVLQPLARQLAGRNLVRYEFRMDADEAGMYWARGRRVLALLGRYEPEEVRDWFYQVPPRSPMPPTVDLLNTASYQVELYLQRLHLFHRPKKEKLMGPTAKSHHSNTPEYRQQQALLAGTPLFHAGDYVQEASVRAVADGYHLTFASRLASARRPDERRRNFELQLDRPALLALRAVIDAALDRRDPGPDTPSLVG